MRELLVGQQQLYKNLRPSSLKLLTSSGQREQVISTDANLDDRLSPSGQRFATSLDGLLEQQRTQQALDTSLWPVNQYNRSRNLRLALRLPSLAQVRLGGVGKGIGIRDSDQTENNSELDENQGREEVPDRETAETSREPAESVVDSDGELSNSAPANEDGNSEAATESPSEESEQETTDNQDENQPAQGDPSSSDETADQPAKESEDVERNEDDTLKEAGHAIDEEVDRMTQPSLGVVSQQDRPFDYKNTVQFDDSLSSGSPPPPKPVEPGDLIARFASPQDESLKPSKARKTSIEPDLQVDHNDHATSNQPRDPKVVKSMKSRDKELVKENEVRGSNLTTSHARDELKSSKLNRINRPKRSSPPVNKIISSYEISNFLDSLNFETLTGQPSTINQKSQPLYLLNETDPLIQANSATVVHKYKQEPLGNLTSKSGDSTSVAAKRSDDEEEGEEEEEEESKDNGGSSNRLSSKGHDDKQSRVDGDPSIKSDHQYIVPNETSIQDLLVQKQLLDALRLSQLPAPYLGDQERNVSGADHQTSGSLYSVDHGLLLYPSADEELAYKSKSKSKKKKKHEKMKAKKKMTVAMKKGGHKNKKHKKEEKKFLKEKKFKGAKKGKKVSKGKGGQGGKKGKKLYKDKGFKKKGFKNVYHKEEFGQKKSYFDEFRDKDFKKKWKKFDDKYNYAQMKKWQAKDIKDAKKMKDHGEKYKKYDKSKWKKKYERHSNEHKASSKKHKMSNEFRR